MQETQVQSLGREDPLEKEMATHSSVPAWKIPWTEKPGGLQSMGSQRVRHSRAAEQQQKQGSQCLHSSYRASGPGHRGPRGFWDGAVRCMRGWATPEAGFARRKGRPGDPSQLAWPPHRWERGHQVIQERPLNRTLSSVFHGFHLHSSSRTNARPKAAAANPIFPDFCVVFLF